MASHFSKSFKVKEAPSKRGNFDLSHNHITTSDFYLPKVSMCRELVPGDHVTHLKIETLTRLSPLVLPTFGRIDLKNRFFFVPFRSVMEGWNEFILQLPYKNKILNQVPVISNLGLMTIFTQHEISRTGVTVPLCESLGSTEPTDHIYDFAFTTSATTPVTTYYKLTSKGRQLYDIFLSLGYSINWCSTDTENVSLLPFYAYLKVLADYYRPTQFFNTLQSGLDALTTFNTSTSKYPDLPQYFVSNPSFLAECLLPVPFESDYFTSAWVNPSGPSASVSGAIQPSILLNDITSDSGYGMEVDNNSAHPGTASIDTSVGTNLTKYALNALDALQGYLVRNNVAGYRVIDRMLAQFGIKLDYKQSNRSLFLGSDVSPIQISDVVSQTNNYDSTTKEGSALGDLAGKGIGYVDGKSIKFDSDEFGVIICISTLIPDTTAGVQGRKRENFHLHALDFFNPNFEGLGVQAIRNDELYATCRNATQYSQWSNQAGQPNGVFGFTPRYSEYKFALDQLTGDFRFNTMNADGASNAFHLYRLLDVNNQFGSGLVLNRNFLFHDNDQYDRIFANDGSIFSHNHFIQIHHIDFKISRPMASLTECLLDDDIEGGKTLEFNGTGTIAD